MNHKLQSLYGSWVRLLIALQSVFLLVIRIIWGWAFFQTGSGKLKNFQSTVEFFTSLNIPMPEVNAAMAATTEMVGGLLLLIGLGSRIVTVPLIVTMLVAYATAHTAELKGIYSNFDGFTEAPPFLFLYACLIVLLFGAGKFSVDYLIGRAKSK